jgi:hypothetical protein
MMLDRMLPLLALSLLFVLPVYDPGSTVISRESAPTVE